MKKNTSILILLFISVFINAQEIDIDLQNIKNRMDDVEEFTAQLQLDLDISFINMPSKMAEMHYTKGEPITFTSTDFILIPKRGLDFSLTEMFKHPFITVLRDPIKIEGKTYKVINVIPTSKHSDFAIATLVLDTTNQRIVQSEINTKKDGTYILNMTYANTDDSLPNKVVVSFEIERVKIPLKYMGSDAEIDKNELKSKEPKTGKIILSINEYQTVLTE